MPLLTMKVSFTVCVLCVNDIKLNDQKPEALAYFLQLDFDPVIILH